MKKIKKIVQKSKKGIGITFINKCNSNFLYTERKIRQNPTVPPKPQKQRTKHLKNTGKDEKVGKNEQKQAKTNDSLKKDTKNIAQYKKSYYNDNSY